MRSLSRALFAASAAACALAATAAGGDLASAAAAVCGPSGYSYAGVVTQRGVHGVAATLTAQSAPQVRSGHVAAWIGVGGAGLGPGGTDAWVQAGISGFSDGRSELYVEVARPGARAVYRRIAPAAAREAHAVSVAEVAGRPGWWQVSVDGRAATAPVFLPGSHGAWAPVATAESWDGGRPTCNRYDFRFDRLRVAAPTGGWQPARTAPVVDNGYRITPAGPGSFVAAVAL